MKKILLLLLAVGAAVVVEEEARRGQARAGTLGRGDRQRHSLLIAARLHPGALAQLVAHLLCKQGVRGSSPLGSTGS